MKGQKHTAAQIIEKLRIADSELANGATQEQIAAKLAVSEVTLVRWREKYGGMQAEEARRLKELELENMRLKRLVADLALDKQILQELVKKRSHPERAAWVGEMDPGDVSSLGETSLRTDGTVADNTAA